MRRRRHVLQVSTFPFLAVLLCTMGSLILLLLVIDKRAKAVARAKAAQEYAERKKTTAEEDKAQQEEWEKQLRNLHAILSRQLDDVRGQADAVHGRINAATADMTSAQGKNRELQDRLEAEKARIAQVVEAITLKKTELARTKANDAATEKQRRQLTGDLALLEKTLEELRAAKKLEKQTFSLVPYKGRRGDNRKPLYLECTAEGWIIHPDRQSIEATHNAVADLHAELERRLKASPSTAESSSYLFLLVRPDGITNYYRAQAAMQGLDVAFGYEFVDGAWVLDFSENSERPVEPWMNTGAAPGAIAASLAKGSPRKAVPSTPPIWYPRGFEGDAADTAHAGQPERFGNSPNETGRGVRPSSAGKSDAAHPLTPDASPPNTGERGVRNPGDGGYIPGRTPAFQVMHGPMVPGLGRGGQGGDPGTTAGQGAGGAWMGVREGVAGPPFRSGVAGGGLGTEAGMPGMAAEGDGGDGTGPHGVGLAPPRPTSGGGDPSGFGQATPGPGTSAGSPVRTGDAKPTRTEDVASSGDALTPGNGTPTGKGDTPSAHPGTNAIRGSPQGPGRVPYPGETPDPNAKPPSKMEVTRGDSTAADPQKADSARGGLDGPALAPKQGRGNGDEEPGERGTPGLDGPSFPRSSNRENSKSGVDKPKPFRLTGNRDWIIPIECTPDGLTLPSGVKIAAGALATGDGGKTLTKAVQDLIARKQATVRDGEPPYRPQVRFLVHPEGLRVYHTAYPILEPLQVPILRQNVDPDDPNQPGTGGRQP
jgi:hypothetical protein